MPAWLRRRRLLKALTSDASLLTDPGYMRKAGVVSVGRGHDDEGRETIVLGVEKLKALGALPREVDGHALVVRELGRLTADD